MQDTPNRFFLRWFVTVFAFVAAQPIILMGQLTPLVVKAQTFQVRGTVKDPMGSVIRRVEIEFQGKSSLTTRSNDSGQYEMDLPLGIYTMTAQAKGFRIYKRPPFCVTSPTDLIFDIMLPVDGDIEVSVRNSDGRALSREEWKAFARPYPGEQSFPLSTHACASQITFRYSNAWIHSGVYSYNGSTSPYDDPVFVAYGLVSFLADKVVYDSKRHTITATSNVTFSDGTGKTCTSSGLTLKIKHGRMIPRSHC